MKGHLLASEGLGDEGFLGADLGECVSHDRSEDRGELVKEGGREAERSAVADGTAQDAAEHVVALSVARLDPVGDGEAEGAQMIGDDAEGDVILLLGVGRREGPVAGRLG